MTKAVSYTHLDVYKRQHGTQADACRPIGWEADTVIGNGQSEMVGRRLHGDGASSRGGMTHNVIDGLESDAVGGDLDGGCLLYTSRCV